MLSRHFIIDASALAPFFLPREKHPGDSKCRLAMFKLISLREEKKANLYVPNFCMAECAKAFARELSKRVKDSDAFRERLLALREILLNSVSKSRKGLIQSIELERVHLEDIEDIFVAEQRMDRRSGGEGLSGLDALIVAIGRVLASEHGQDNVRIITSDEWLASVCNRSDGRFPRAINAAKQGVPDG